MKKWVIYSSLFGMASFGLFGCSGIVPLLLDAGGNWADFDTVIFSSAGVNVNPRIVPIVKAQTQQISDFNPLKACVGDANKNGRCDSDEPGCRTCADVPVGTPCDNNKDFRTVCCTQVERCVGTPTQWTITFNFRSVPRFDARGKPLPRPTSPVIIQGYTEVFDYSPGCPPLLFASDPETVYYVVPAPSGGASTAQVSIKYRTESFASYNPIPPNVCRTTATRNYGPPPDFPGVCNIKAVYIWTVKEQYSGKVKKVSVPVSFQIVRSTGDCVP
jgi:hypothetical protein